MKNYKGEEITSETRVMSAREGENYGIAFREENKNIITMPCNNEKEFKAFLDSLK